MTSLAYSAGEAAISYHTGGPKGRLKVARRTNSVWTTEKVDPGAGAGYSSLAFDPLGNPAVAYSDDINGDGGIATLKFASWNGSSWDIEIVDTGPVGYGVFATLAFDPITENFSVAHRGTGQVCFFRWEPERKWVLEEIDNTTQYIRGVSLTYGQDGTAYLAFGANYDGENTNMTVASRDPISGNWALETVDLEPKGPFLISVRIAPDGQPSVSYQGYASSMRFAKKGGLEGGVNLVSE